MPHTITVRSNPEEKTLAEDVITRALQVLSASALLIPAMISSIKSPVKVLTGPFLRIIDAIPFLSAFDTITRGSTAPVEEVAPIVDEDAVDSLDAAPEKH